MSDDKNRRRERAAQSGAILQQVGALPYRTNKDGSLEVMLITSRETKRFTLPKGWRMKGKSDHKAARIEAMEEAGVEGKIARKSIGSYFYWKRIDRCFIPVRVTVYPLQAKRTRSRWKERHQRLRKWLQPNDAALLVDEPELMTLLHQAGSDSGHPSLAAPP
ncbi:8-oxo-dGTP pyrophosphatase MutT (NUDIX family) [Mycoplana sp. BE70]|uniref:NUDIX hydrolase n=1 Tax=Mycoplana sp. BE70 TaxID=2817775 RepID=UPI00285C23AE|nr:NUDIX hydrolase [Mycoplana sp. BE70]MDR6757015.1 8-oxo-dGTP pyrophosphatase MutT (NUDIX family) [Mycoplana sp. BE70]